MGTAGQPSIFGPTAPINSRVLGVGLLVISEPPRAYKYSFQRRWLGCFLLGFACFSWRREKTTLERALFILELPPLISNLGQASLLDLLLLILCILVSRDDNPYVFMWILCCLTSCLATIDF